MRRKENELADWEKRWKRDGALPPLDSESIRTGRTAIFPSFCGRGQPFARHKLRPTRSLLILLKFVVNPPDDVATVRCRREETRQCKPQRHIPVCDLMSRREFTRVFHADRNSLIKRGDRTTRLTENLFLARERER